MKKREKAAEPCNMKPVRRTEWRHTAEGNDTRYDGGRFTLTACDTGAAILGLGGFMSYASATGLTDEDLRCLAEQFIAAADQLTVWRCEP